MPDKYMNTPQEVGQRVRARRKELGIGQAALGEMIGYSPNRISEFERDGIDSLTLLSEIASALQISSAELLYKTPIFSDPFTLDQWAEDYEKQVDSYVRKLVEYAKEAQSLLVRPEVMFYHLYRMKSLSQEEQLTIGSYAKCDLALELLKEAVSSMSIEQFIKCLKGEKDC